MENPTLPTNWLAELSNANHVRKQKIGQNSLTQIKTLTLGIRFSVMSGAFSWDFL